MASEWDIRMSDAVDAGDHEEIRATMKDAKANLQEEGYRYFLAKTLMMMFPCKDVDTVRAAAEQDPDILRWLTPWHLNQELSRDLLNAVVDLGWDINTRDEDSASAAGWRPSLLQYVSGDEDLVKWCLDNGASVQDPTDIDPHACSPVLEWVAGGGTVSTFKLLRSRGAPLAERILHKAVAAAANSSKSSPKHAARMEMVKYLVEDLKLDVNAMDTQEVRIRHFGPPLCYALKGREPEEVVRYLLEHGADPTIKDCQQERDATDIAHYEHPELVSLLKEHIKQ